MPGLKEWAENQQAKQQSAKQQALDEQVAKGRLSKCVQCQEVFGKHLTECPKCGEYTDPSAPRRTILIRIYNKGDVAKAFQEDAMFLSQFGWKPQTQSAGGVKAGMNLNIGLGIGRGGSRNAKEMTVSYARD